MHKVYFAGCGPGDPELITVKARRLIRQADAIVYSGSLIPKPILEEAKGRLYDASGMIREEIFAILRDNAAEGKLTVRLHDGDPTIYGAIREQMDELKKEGIESEIVPGVTSFLASAAALGTQLTLPGVTQTIIITRAEKRTQVPEREQIKSLAEHRSSMAFYLSVHLLGEIVRELLAGGYAESTPAAVVYRASWEDQKIITGTLNDIETKVRKAKITKTAIILVGDALSPESYEHSKLYDKNFGHGYRKARRQP